MRRVRWSERGRRQAAEGSGCDVTAQQRPRLPQKGQRRQRGAVFFAETERPAETEGSVQKLDFGPLNQHFRHLKTVSGVNTSKDCCLVFWSR